MQTFSGMQRSFAYQNALNLFVLAAVFVAYISLSSLYLLLPPMLAVLFLAYTRYLQRHDLLGVIAVSLMLLVFEAEKGFWFGSTILFFSLLVKYAIPRIEQLVQCRLCLAAIFTLLAYPGFWVFTWIADKILMLAPPVADWHMILYCAVEFLIVAAFV